MRSNLILRGVPLLLLLAAAVLLARAQSAGTPRTAPAQKVDSILVLKKDHVLELLSGGEVIHSYKVALGTGGLTPKEREGDGRVPEGQYIIDSRNEHSAYYRSLHISYPNAADRRRAARQGVPPGGEIMIHGLPNGMGWIGSAHRLHDWTKGCVAVTDQEMDEIWKMVSVGTPVEIRP
jgi:murein L,D-transpeptidase YafK